MTTILVPLDGSRLAEQALPVVRRIARPLAARVQLLHVVPPMVTETLLLLNAPLLVGDPTASRDAREHHLAQRLQHDATLYLTAQVEALRVTGLEVDCSVVLGDPAEELVAQAAAHAPALIVMASHGYSGLTRWELGSVADRVIQTSDTPVVVVRAGQEPGNSGATVQRILVPLDGSPLAEEALPHAVALAQGSGAELVLLRVLEPLALVAPSIYGAYYMPDRYGEQLQAWNDEALHKLRVTADALHAQLGIPVRALVRQDAPANGIVTVARELDVDLVVLATHGYGGLKRWMLGSVADKVVHASPVPTLVVPVHPRHAASTARDAAEALVHF